MKNKFLAVMLVVFLAMSIFTGCDAGNFGKSSETEEVSLAVVTRIGSNFGTISANSETLNELMYTAAYSYGHISIVRCDGNPEIVASFDITKPSVSGLSADRLDTEANKAVRTAQAAFSKARAVEPEVDTLQGIALAGTTLSGRSGDRYLLVMDSGVSTDGYMDFTDNLLNAEPEDIVAALKEAHALPDLRGIHVIWLFLAQTAEPQQELSSAQQYKLRTIWEKVLRAAGAEDVLFNDIDRTSKSDFNDAPYVSIVDVDERKIHVPILPRASEPELTVMETVVLDESRVRFLGDQAVFADKNEAEAAIRSAADALLQNPQNRVLVVGTTAGSGSSNFSIALSKARAEAVRDALICFGVDEERMICLGLGGNDPWHIEDTDSSGLLIEEKAQHNRKVLIIDVNSADAELLNDY